MTRARPPRPAEIDAARHDPRLRLALTVRGRPDPTWRQRAACRDVDTELFFPEPSEPKGAALVLCRQCPTRGHCLAEALESRQDVGIWGGTTEAGRRAMSAAWRNPQGHPNSRKTHCPRGHAYDGDNILWTAGRRNCRECVRRNRHRRATTGAR